MTTEPSPDNARDPLCPLCVQSGGEVLWDDGFARVVLADEPDYPGFCRVILQAPRKEMTDLAEVERHALMAIVFAVESLVRELLRPDKINLASLGNGVAHVHWHVILRYRGDAHFPDAVWSTRQRDNARRLPASFARTTRQRLGERLAR
jgi:diadenosine tetraphosphate (Ap4A) HIT family hydrolase